MSGGADRWVIPFGMLGLDELELVGGKAARLGDLTQAGFPVPPGFAVTTLAYEREEAFESIVDGYRRLGEQLGIEQPPVAVRSSAVAEDTEAASFAGVQDTYLWLCGADAVADGVRRCWHSYWNPEAVAYRAEHGVEAGGMSVAIQYMVDARVAGVMFTLNPVSGDPSTLAIDASYGLGTTVVGGEVTPDSFLWSKVQRQLISSTIGSKEIEVVAAPDGSGTVTRAVEPERRARACLTPDEVAQLADLAGRVQRHYGSHQDLEWAIDRRLDEVFLLQSRPETVWSNKPRQPAAATDPLSAIAAAFLPRR